MEEGGYSITCLYYSITSLHALTKKEKTLATIIRILPANWTEHHTKNVTASATLLKH
jgi:hypothetical protein